MLGKFKIRYRLIVGFVLMVLLTVLIGVSAMMKMKTIANQTHNMYKQPLIVGNAVRDIQFYVVSMHHIMIEAVIADNDQEVENAKKTLKEYENTVYRNFDLIYERFWGDKKQIDEAFEAFREWKTIRDEVFYFVYLGDRDSALAVVKTLGAEHMQQMKQKIEVMTNAAMEQSKWFYVEAENVRTNSLKSMLVLVAFSLVAGLLIALIITRSITHPLRNIITGMKAIIDGNVDERLNIYRKDEIGELANTFREMQSRLRYKAAVEKQENEWNDWMKSGQNQLYSKMSGDLTIEELGNNVINFLTKYVGAHIGVVYALFERTKYLKLVGSYSLTQHEKVKKFIRVGEGLTGQAVLDKQNMVIENLESDYFLDRTSAVTITPKNVFIAPFIYRDKVIGVVELASFKKLSDREIQFIEIALSNVAIAFHTTMIRSRSRFKEFIATQGQPVS